MKVANLWKSNSWLVGGYTAQTVNLCGRILKCLSLGFLTFSATRCIFLAKFEEESLWFTESAPWVHTFLQLLVQICHNQMQTQKCMIFKFNTNLLLLNKHFFIAYYKSIATSYHDITIIVTMTIFNSISSPIILQSEVLVLDLVSLDKVTISLSKYISLWKISKAIFHGSGTLAICKNKYFEDQPNPSYFKLLFSGAFVWIISRMQDTPKNAKLFWADFFWTEEKFH